MLFLTSCLSFSLSSCKRRNGRARAHAIRTCRYSNMFEKQNSLYRLKKGAECELKARTPARKPPTVLMRLLQICLVYINTLLVQKVLSEKEWLGKMQPEDFRGLIPLFYG